MIQFTTPTFKIRLLKNKTVYDDFICDYLLVTLTSECTVIEKKIPYEDIEEGIFYVHFTQEETAMLKVGEVCEMQLNVMRSGERFASKTKRLVVSKNLHKAVIHSD